MAKGDDALRRKRNKANRKRLRNSESSVSARVASIIAAKFRRKAGKRRICEGMCFSLPTADDPFNERHEKKSMEKNKKSKKQKLNRRNNRQTKSDSTKDTDNKLQEEKALMKKTVEKTGCNGEAGGFDDGSASKFLMLCLKAVEDAWVEEGTLNKDMIGALPSSSWGTEFFRVCSAGSSVVVTSGASATRDQVSWLVSTAADMVTRKEKQGIIVASPFLLYIVPSRDRAIEVRAVCKPLKALGIHTVSLHSGTSLDHQVHGLKNCEPEFIVSTPERLLELVSLKAVGISGTSLLVVDGLRKFVDLGLLDNLKSIRERISGDPQIITFSEGLGEMPVTVLLQHLIRGPVYRLFEHESVASTSNFVSQYIHLYSSEGEKLSEGRFEILSLSGSFTITDFDGVRSRTGGISISLAGPDGRVIGGGVAGLLLAASPIQVVVGSFLPNAFKEHKRKLNQDSSPFPSILPSSSTADVPPLSHATEECEDTKSTIQDPTSGGTHSNVINITDLNPPSFRSVHWQGLQPSSGQKSSPDINVCLRE